MEELTSKLVSGSYKSKKTIEQSDLSIRLKAKVMDMLIELCSGFIFAAIIDLKISEEYF